MAKDTLLVLMHWLPSDSQVQELTQQYPNLNVITHRIQISDQDVPKEITDETWATVTYMLTWNTLPKKEQAPNLKYVQLLSAGCNHILDLPLFKETKIAFCTANGVHGPNIAEWVFATFLGYQHHFRKFYENSKIEKWIYPVRDDDTEDSVGLKVGILGYGAIGRQVARVATALGMDVHVYTLHARNTPESRKSDTYVDPGLGDPEGVLPAKWFHGKDQLHDFLASDLDLLVLLTPLTPVTRGIIGKKELELLSKKQAYLSNAARGGVVDTDALIEAVEKGWIRGAALDVTDPEPLPEGHKLWKFENVTITPHAAGNTDKYYTRTWRILQQNLERLGTDKNLVNVVDRQLGY